MSKTKEYLIETNEKDFYIATKLTFEEFMKGVHAEDYHGTDDDMPDNFELWESNLDIQEVIDYAEEFVALIRSKVEGLTPEYNPN